MTASAGSLDGRRALVTGAASGIGAACARALAGAVAVWLAGPSAGMACGSSVTIDGGWSAK